MPQNMSYRAIIESSKVIRDTASLPALTGVGRFLGLRQGTGHYSIG